MTAYYNENNPEAAETLRELIKAGAIAPGVVDERSILDVLPSEVAGHTQCHFFAGGGVWSYALRLAGWPDNRPVWTGSCPCQPFSTAGKGTGFADERHLWPVWFHLIEHGKRYDVPVYGEQVASKDGLAWLDLVWSDLEGGGYTFRPFNLCAAGFGVPHIRQRLYFVANALSLRNDRSPGDSAGTQTTPQGRRKENAVFDEIGDNGADDALADTRHKGREGRLSGRQGAQRENQHGRSGRDSAAGRMADPYDAEWWADFSGGDNGYRPEAGRQESDGECRAYSDVVIAPRNQYAGPVNGHWRDADWLFCRDGKWRPVEPGTFPLVDGAAGRVGRLRLYGNAIVAQQAAAFIEASLEDV